MGEIREKGEIHAGEQGKKRGKRRYMYGEEGK